MYYFLLCISSLVNGWSSRALSSIGLIFCFAKAAFTHVMYSSHNSVHSLWSDLPFKNFSVYHTLKQSSYLFLAGVHSGANDTDMTFPIGSTKSHCDGKAGAPTHHACRCRELSTRKQAGTICLLAMKRYSIAPGLSRRKSAHAGSAVGSDPAATLELEKLEQEITLTLQEIDKNLSKANTVISEKMFPILAKYAQLSQKVWSNVNFWKYFLEQAADVELTSYEAPANMGTNLNTIANAKRTEGAQDAETTSKSTGDWLENENEKDTNHAHRLDVTKKQGQVFAGLEQTPTWSPQPHEPQTIQASTPEGVHSTSAAAPVQPTPQMITHTIRQSLDNYQRISISPRKETNATASERKRRDSVIRNFINSSPTLPEPPVLVSEFGDGEWNKEPAGSPAKNRAVATPQRLRPSTGDQNSLQRFPRTPNLAADAPQNVDIMRTPLGVRIRYGEDSELAPPELETNTKAPQTSSQDDVPQHKRPRLSTADDDQNVFLEQGKRAQTSRDNTHTNSNMLEAFEEAASTSSVNVKTKEAANHQDLFASIEHDTTDNSTSELGQFYRERLKEFTNYGKRNQSN